MTIVLNPQLPDTVLTKPENYKLIKGHFCFWAIILYCIAQVLLLCLPHILVYTRGESEDALFQSFELHCNNISAIITF